MAQHGTPAFTAGAATNSPRTAGTEPRRASKPQYTQTKKEPLGEGSFAKVRPVQVPASVNDRMPSARGLKQGAPTLSTKQSTMLARPVSGAGPRVCAQSPICDDDPEP